MNVKNKHLKITAQIFKGLNTFFLVVLLLTFSKTVTYFPYALVDFIADNFASIFYTAYLFLFISIVAAFMITGRSKKEKYVVFFNYLAHTVINIFAYVIQYSLSKGFPGQLFG